MFVTMPGHGFGSLKHRQLRHEVQTNSIDMLLGKLKVVVHHRCCLQTALSKDKHGEDTTINPVVLLWHRIEWSNYAVPASPRTLPTRQFCGHVEEGIQIAEKGVVSLLWIQWSSQRVEDKNVVNPVFAKATSNNRK